MTTWPEMENDFAARDHDGIDVGRFYVIEHGPSQQQWRWTVTTFHAAPIADTGPQK